MYRSLPLVAYLREIFYSFVIIWFHPHLIVDVESGGVTLLHYHLDKNIIYQTLLFQHLEPYYTFGKYFSWVHVMNSFFT
jgi:hypothetical protein